MIHIWKVLNGVVPKDLNIESMPRSRLGLKVQLPAMVKYSSQRNQSLYDSFVAVMGPRVWNILPSHLHHIQEPQQFKIELTEFVNLFPDKPPVSV